MELCPQLRIVGNRVAKEGQAPLGRKGLLLLLMVDMVHGRQGWSDGWRMLMIGESQRILRDASAKIRDDKLYLAGDYGKTRLFLEVVCFHESVELLGIQSRGSPFEGGLTRKTVCVFVV